MIILHENVLIEQIDKGETTTASGLIITNTSFDGLYQKAKVVSKGTGIKDPYIRKDVEVLDTKGTGNAIQGDDGVEYLLVPYEAIVGVL